MKNNKFCYLKNVDDPNAIITPIDGAMKFPEILDISRKKYSADIQTFIKLINDSDSSAEMLDVIRSSQFTAAERMSLLKMFRRCVSPVLDTEATKKIKKITTLSLVENYGHTFKPIDILKKQFSEISSDYLSALAALVGEYDTRGQSGYQLTEQFFTWFEKHFIGQLRIEGPRGAGRDIELKKIFPDFNGSFPCDFIIRDELTADVLAVGFARYDATRGGAQSDDRTGGNANKVEKAMRYHESSGRHFKIIYLSDGPGLCHKDTWQEACELDGSWNGNVRVTTLKLAAERVTLDWLQR